MLIKYSPAETNKVFDAVLFLCSKFDMELRVMLGQYNENSD